MQYLSWLAEETTLRCTTVEAWVCRVSLASQSISEDAHVSPEIGHALHVVHAARYRYAFMVYVGRTTSGTTLS